VGFEPTTTYVSSVNVAQIHLHARQVFYQAKLSAHKRNIFLVDNLSAFNYTTLQVVNFMLQLLVT
jgi:hypothetical protein